MAAFGVLLHLFLLFIWTWIADQCFYLITPSPVANNVFVPCQPRRSTIKNSFQAPKRPFICEYNAVFCALMNKTQLMYLDSRKLKLHMSEFSDRVCPWVVKISRLRLKYSATKELELKVGFASSTSQITMQDAFIFHIWIKGGNGKAVIANWQWRYPDKLPYLHQLYGI